MNCTLQGQKLYFDLVLSIPDPSLKIINKHGILVVSKKMASCSIKIRTWILINWYFCLRLAYAEYKLREKPTNIWTICRVVTQRARGFGTFTPIDCKKFKSSTTIFYDLKYEIKKLCRKLIFISKSNCLLVERSKSTLRNESRYSCSCTT